MTRLMRRRRGAAATLLPSAWRLHARRRRPRSRWSPVWGGWLYGLSLAALAAWLVCFDIARRTVRAHGLSRYMAVCLLLRLCLARRRGPGVDRDVRWASGARRGAACAGPRLRLQHDAGARAGHPAGARPRQAAVRLVLLRPAGRRCTSRWWCGCSSARSTSALRSAGAAGNAAAIALFAADRRGLRRGLAPEAFGLLQNAPCDRCTIIEEPPRAPRAASPCGTWASGRSTCSRASSRRCRFRSGRCSSRACCRLAYLAGPVWHAHEMLFGFVLAVIVGFLFTAGRNWTNQPTPSGAALAALAGLWLAGRVLVLTPFGWAAAVVNVAFPLAAAVALAIPFIKARNRRNYFFVGLLVLMSVAAGFVHLAQLGVIGLPAWVGLQLGLDVVLFIVSVMGGRVIPMFTNNGVPGASAAPQAVRREGGARAGAGVARRRRERAHGSAARRRARRWPAWRTRRDGRCGSPGRRSRFRSSGCSISPTSGCLRTWRCERWPSSAVVASSSATHALTVGAVGGLIIGMMTRTARGHTARPLRADRFDIACYVLVALAGVVRVALPLLAPAQTLVAVQCSAVLWSAGFGLYAVRYWPVLTRARLDGKPG